MLFRSPGQNSLFFHPGSTMFRVKRFKKGGYDPYLEAMKLEKGTTVFDATLGMATDAILASYIVGESGKVFGVEKNPILAYLVKDGLQTFKYPLDPLFEVAMRAIKVKSGDYISLLKEMKKNTWDVVYFDPMFHQPIEASKGIEPLRTVSCYDQLTEKGIKEALRVARQRVVVKAHYCSPVFEQYGMQVYRRKTAQFHYGVIEKNGSVNL